MDTGQKLPARMYLLAYDLDKDTPSGLAALEDELTQAGTFERKGRGLVAMDREAIATLQARARQILRGEAGDEGSALPDAALVAMASVIPLRTVFERRRRRPYRERIDTLTRRVSLRAPGFDRMLQQMRRSRGRAYSSGGPVH